MPINVFGSTSGNNEKKIDTSLLVQKPYLRIKFFESHIEKDIDMKSQNKSKKLFNPPSIRQAASDIYVDYLFNDPGIKKTLLMLTSMIKISITFYLLTYNHSCLLFNI